VYATLLELLNEGIELKPINIRLKSGLQL